MPNGNKQMFLFLFLWYNLVATMAMIGVRVPHLWYIFMHNIAVAIAMIIKTRILLRAAPV